MNYGILKSKFAIGVYVSLAILIATVFGKQDILCEFDMLQSFVAEDCAQVAGE